MVATITAGLFAATTLALGLFLSFMSYLTRRNECFAVTVPSAAQSDLRLAALKRRYAATMIALTLAFTALAAFAGFLIAGDTSRQDAATSGLGGVVACAAALGPAVASFPLMLRNRRKVAAIKRAEG